MLKIERIQYIAFFLDKRPRIMFVFTEIFNLFRKKNCCELKGLACYSQTIDGMSSQYNVLNWYKI